MDSVKAEGQKNAQWFQHCVQELRKRSCLYDDDDAYKAGHVEVPARKMVTVLNMVQGGSRKASAKCKRIAAIVVDPVYNVGKKGALSQSGGFAPVL